MNVQAVQRQWVAVCSPVSVLSGLLLLQLAFFSQSYWSMVQIWWRSDTFAHGFFILPISAYLIWRKRRQLASVEFKPDARALGVLFILGVLWLAGVLVDALVVHQFAAVLMIPALIWLVLGTQASSIIMFPLAFLLFAVPFGEFLVYPMMKFTAAFTVHAVRALGIPVFWEGMYFTLPTGSWSVVEACSGFRYILASLTLGSLYAYLTYASYWRRTSFMLFALLLPVIANGLRAFMIVLIGHYSGMELAVGVDHLIYGWVWFGLVMFFMFWAGSFWQDNKDNTALVSSPSVTHPPSPRAGGHRLALISTLAIMVLITPVLIANVETSTSDSRVIVEAPQPGPLWRTENVELFTQWQPSYYHPTQEIHQAYASQAATVGLHIAYYGDQHQDEELVNRQHSLVALDQEAWREPYRTTRQLVLGGREISVTEAQITSKDQHLLVWQWKYVNGVHTSNDFVVKALEAWARLTGKPRHGAAIVLYIEDNQIAQNHTKVARAHLKDFAESVLPALEQQLD